MISKFIQLITILLEENVLKVKHRLPCDDEKHKMDIIVTSYDIGAGLLGWTIHSSNTNFFIHLGEILL